jgi:hypothetical protein
VGRRSGRKGKPRAAAELNVGATWEQLRPNTTKNEESGPTSDQDETTILDSKPLLIGFASEDDWFEYRLEHHPEFLNRVAKARAALREGRGVPLEQI